MLLACTSTQKAYAIGQLTLTGPLEGTQADSPGESCQHWSRVLGTYPASVTGFQCTTQLQPSIGYPVIKLCDDAPAFTVEKMQDMVTLWGLFLLAAIVILSARKLLNVFDKAPHVES